MTNAITPVLAQFIANKILKQPKRVISENEKLISSGLIDSMSLIDLSLFVEDTFNVHLDDTELNAEMFDTLAQLTVLIQTRQS